MARLLVITLFASSSAFVFAMEKPSGSDLGTQPDSSPTPICAQWGSSERIANLDNTQINESSGLAASWLRKDILWTHNDSGDQARLFAIDKLSGETHSELVVENATNVDWEDMAIAPCSTSDPRPCIYVADIGDNLSRRDTVSIYRFPEPKLPQSAGKRVRIDNAEELRFRYPDGPRDAETLLVHPVDGRIYVVDKDTAITSSVYRVPAQFGEELVNAEKIAELRFHHILPPARMTTAGDIAPNGREFSIRTYLNVYTFCATEGEDFESAFNNSPTLLQRPPMMIQSEALTYDRKDNSLWITSEGSPAPLFRITRQHNRPPSTEP